MSSNYTQEPLQLTTDEKLKQLSEKKTNNISSSIPIVLIDNSGSTSSYIQGTTTLQHEVDLIQTKLTNLNCKQCYLMFWNSKHTLINDPVNVADLRNTFKNNKIKSTGGTDISVAIQHIPDGWYQKHTHIYIVTDGEVNEDKHKFATQVFSLAKRFVNLNIITVETNKHNYTKNNVDAGSNIFTTIQNNKLTKYVRSFECFNNFHVTEPFVNLCNPDVGNDEFCCREYVFKNEKFHDFVNIICEIVNQNRNNTEYLDKVMYHLSFTIFSYTKNKSQKIKNEVVNLFTSLFEEVNADTQKLTSIFEAEITSHTEGACKTFQQYKENRKKLFERTLDDLKNNVMDCFAMGNRFMSFVINTKDPTVKKILESNNTNSYVRLSDSFYNNAGVHYGNHYLPMLSVGVSDTDNAHQAVRQWIRAIYARVHQIQVNDERILYLFLTDMMSVVLSNNLPENIKNAYIKYAKIMLDAKRFNSGDLKQIVFLTMGNKPKPMISGYFTMEEIFEQCRKHFSKDHCEDITNDDLWYGICLTYDDKKLTKAQLPKTFNKGTLLTKLKQYNANYTYENVAMEKELEYEDYMTQENITETGGYRYPDYKYGKRFFKSSLLISHSTYNKLVQSSTDGCVKCPITGTNLKLSTFVVIPPKVQGDNNVVMNDTEFDMNIFNKLYFQKVNLMEYDKMNLQNLPLKPVEQYDFVNYPYEFNPSVPIISEKLYKEKEQYRTLTDFKNQVKLRYDWLNEVNLQNAAIAGGFTKSIILDEKVNDIDVYMYYEEDDDKKYMEILTRLMKDITTALAKKYDKMVYLAAYKTQFNVYEVIAFDNVKNLVKNKYELQDLTQMKFIVKIQIIMKKHKEPKDIFNLYDLDSCCVLYNGEQLLFNDRSYLSYRYLLNIPRADQLYTDVFDMRLLKYYKSGFRIALPRLTIDQIKGKLDTDNYLVLNMCKFHVQEIQNNNVFVDKCELLVEKVEKVEKVDENAKLDQKGVSVYNSVIGELGSLDDSRSIVKFMKYVQRQNKLVERVKRKLEDGETVNEESLLTEINKEMSDETKQKLKNLKLRGKKYVKHEALLSKDDDMISDDDLDDDKNVDAVADAVAEADADTDFVVVDDNSKPEVKSQTVNDVEEQVITEENPNPNPDPNNSDDQPLKKPEEYIKVYYKVSTSTDTRKMNEFDNGTTDLKFIWNYENYHKEKDWYNSNVDVQNRIVEEKNKIIDEKRKLAMEAAKQKKLDAKSSADADEESEEELTKKPLVAKQKTKSCAKRCGNQSDSSSSQEESDEDSE